MSSNKANSLGFAPTKNAALLLFQFPEKRLQSRCLGSKDDIPCHGFVMVSTKLDHSFIHLSQRNFGLDQLLSDTETQKTPCWTCLHDFHLGFVAGSGFCHTGTDVDASLQSCDFSIGVVEFGRQLRRLLLVFLQRSREGLVLLHQRLHHLVLRSLLLHQLIPDEQKP